MQLFKDILSPCVCCFIIIYVLCTALTKYECVSLGDMYKVDNKVVLMECYLKSGDTWVTEQYFSILAIPQALVGIDRNE